MNHSSIANLLSRFALKARLHVQKIRLLPLSVAEPRESNGEHTGSINDFLCNSYLFGSRCLIDETTVKTNLTRLRGRSQRGERLTMDAPSGSWATQTLIAELTQDALFAPWVIKGVMDCHAFTPTSAKC